MGNTLVENVSFPRGIPEENWIPNKLEASGTSYNQICTHTCKVACSEAIIGMPCS